jgi:hypothetical protein
LNFFKKIELPTFKTSGGIERILQEIAGETKLKQQGI